MLGHIEEWPLASNYAIENSISAGRICGQVCDVTPSTFHPSNTTLQRHLLLTKVSSACALLVPAAWLV